MKPLAQLHQIVQSIENNKTLTSRNLTPKENQTLSQRVSKEQQIQDLVKKQTNEFKVEIEKRYARSRHNHTFRFPEQQMLESSSDSSLEEAGIYNLHVQNSHSQGLQNRVKSILKNNENNSLKQNNSILLKLLQRTSQQTPLKQVRSPCYSNQSGFFSKISNNANASFNSTRPNKVENSQISIQKPAIPSRSTENTLRATNSNNSFYQNTQRSNNTRNVSLYQQSNQSITKTYSQHGFLAATNNNNNNSQNVNNTKNNNNNNNYINNNENNNYSSRISLNKTNSTLEDRVNRKLQTESSINIKQPLREWSNNLVSPTIKNDIKISHINTSSGTKLSDTSKYIQIDNYLNSAKSNYFRNMNLSSQNKAAEQFIKIGSITGRAGVIKNDLRQKKFEFKTDKIANFSMGY